MTTSVQLTAHRGKGFDEISRSTIASSLADESGDASATESDFHKILRQDDSPTSRDPEKSTVYRWSGTIVKAPPRTADSGTTKPDSKPESDSTAAMVMLPSAEQELHRLKPVPPDASFDQDSGEDSQSRLKPPQPASVDENESGESQSSATATDGQPDADVVQQAQAALTLEGSPAPVAPVLLKTIDAQAPEASHIKPRVAGNAAPQPATLPAVAPPPSQDLLSPNLLSPDDDKQSSDGSNPGKPAQASAPVEWKIESDDPRTQTVSRSSDPIAFEAKFSPAPAAPAVATADNLPPRSEPPAATRSVAVTPDPAPEEHNVPETKPEVLFKTELPAPVAAAPATSQAKPAAAAQIDAPIAAQMQPMIEAPAALSNRSISVNVPVAADDANINLRFIERGGEIHVSVRTSDAGLAQDLRGGLNDLAGRLEHAGIRTEIATPATTQSNPQRDSQQQPSEHRGSGRQQSDSQREQQESRKNDSSRWRKALEDSTGDNANFSKEQNA